MVWGIGLLMLIALVAKGYYGLPEGGFWAGVWGWAGVAMNLAVVAAAVFLKPSFRLWCGLTLLHLFLGGLSIAHMAVGNKTCGCFGRTEVAPFDTFLLCSVIVGILAFTFPPRR